MIKEYIDLYHVCSAVKVYAKLQEKRIRENILGFSLLESDMCFYVYLE